MIAETAGVMAKGRSRSVEATALPVVRRASGTASSRPITISMPTARPTKSRVTRKSWRMVASRKTSP
jgi:hypothetical protein